MGKKKAPLPSELNICFVAKQFPILGRAVDYGFLWPLARGLARRGHQVTVLSWQNPERKDEIYQEGVRGFYLAKPRVSARDFPKAAEQKFLELHKQKPFHVVHSLDASGRDIGKKKRSHRIAMAYDVDATQMSQIFSIMGMSQESLRSLLRTALAVAYKFLSTYWTRDRKLLNTADAVFVTSPQQRIALERYYLYPELRTFTIPYGMEVGDLSPREKSDELKARLGLPADALIAVTVSDMTEFNEMKNVLTAFEKVAIKKPSARLIVIGDGPLFKQIEFFMLNLVLGSKVIFTKTVSTMALQDHIALADVFINLSARSTGFEPSLLEAMAQKKVIIGSEVSPINTIVDDGIDGYLIRPADVDSLASLLLEAFSNPELTAAVGERARGKVLNLFDTEKMVNQTIAAYYQTLRRSGYYEKAKPRAE